jgi:hypothetical protein
MLLVTSGSNSTNIVAADFPNDSNYSPLRPGETSIEGGLGLTYPSFNNFTNNNNMGMPPYVAGTDGGANERQFLVGKYCTDANCAGTYFNTTTHYFQPGDKIRFKTYFHNNGEDAYDGGTVGSPDAQNFQVGIELNNIQDPTYDNMLRPRSFLYADNNEYRTDKNNATTVIKSNGSVVRKATDDMQVITDELGLMLKPSQNYAALYLPSISYQQAITGPTNITFTTATPQQTVTVTPYFESNRMYLQFNRYPGCFRYNGFAYFDAVVVRNSCESLTANKTDTGVIKDGKNLYKLSKTSLTFAETGTTIPSNIRYKWTTTDSTGKFYTSTTATTFSTNSITTSTSEIYYAGYGKVTLILAQLGNAGQELSPTPAYLEPNICQANFDFPVPANVCTALTATHSFTDDVLTTVGGQLATVHKINYTGLTFSSGTIPAGTKIKFESTDLTGKFYTKPSTTYTQVGTNNTYTTADAMAPKAIYYVGSGTVSVHPVKSNGTEDPNLNTTECKKSLVISPDYTYCTALQSTPVQSAYTDVNGTTVYLHALKKADNFPTYSYGDLPFTKGLKWTTNNANGKFYKQPSSNTYILQGNSTASRLTDTIYYSGNAGDIVTMKLIKIDTLAKEVTPTALELTQLNQAVCTSTFTMPAEPSGVCSALDVTFTTSDDILTTISGKLVTVRTLKYNSLAFSSGTHKQESELGLKWTSTDRAGRFYTKSSTGAYIQAGTTNSYVSAPPATIYYAGYGNVSVHPVLANGTDDPTLNTTNCNKTFPFSTEITYCTGLKNAPVQSAYTIVNGTNVYLHTLKKADDFPTYLAGNPAFTAGLRWTTTNPSGKFYKLTSSGAYTFHGDYMTSTLTETMYYVGKGGDVITTTLIKIDASGFELVPTAQELLQLNQLVCTDTITIPNEPPAPACDHIIVTANDTTTPPGNIFKNSWTGLKATAVDTNGDAFGQSFKFSTYPNFGMLYETKPADLNNPGTGYENLDTVAPNTNVFLHALNPRIDAVTISTNGTTVPACSMKLNIGEIAPSPICLANTVVIVNDDGTETPLPTGSNLLPGTYKIKSTNTYDRTLSGAPSISTFTTTQGGFYATNPAEIKNQLSTLDGTPVFLEIPASVTSEIGAIKVEAANFDAAKICVSTFNIIVPSSPVCTSLETTITEADGTLVTGLLSQNKIYTVVSKSNYTNAPSNPEVTYTTTKGIFVPNSVYLISLIAVGGVTSEEFATLYPYFDPTEPATVADNTTVYFLAFKDQEGPNAFTVQAKGFESVCSKTFDLALIPIPAVCQGNTVTLIDSLTGIELTLAPNFEFKPGVYELKSTNTYDPALDIPAASTFTTTQGGFTLIRNLPLNFQTEVTVLDGTSVFLTIPNTAVTTANDITVKAVSNDPTNICVSRFNVDNTPIVTPEACASIEVTMNPSSDFDPENLTSFKLTNGVLNDFDNPASQFEFSATYGNFYIPGKEPEGATTRTFTLTEFQDALGIAFHADNNDSDNTINIRAIGDYKGTNCNFSTSFEHEGDCTNCGHSHNPSIVKSVYNPKTNNWTTGKIYYGTRGLYANIIYKVTLTTAGISSATIHEPSNLPGKTIAGQDPSIRVSLILNKRAIVKDGNLICNDEITKGLNKSTNVISCTEYFKKTETVRESGDDLIFTGLGNTQTLEVYYEYTNAPLIIDELCKTLKSDTGCGLEFPNTATLKDHNSSSAIVQVLCPYIITRQSGDVFFHEEIGTTDLQSCAKIDNSTGLILRPTKEKGPTVPTGTPGETPITWQAGTHDVCKLSGSEDLSKDLPTGYQNALKNFSSSVCEMEGDVAKEWKEKFINQAIENNITKISRWGASKGPETYLNTNGITSKSGIIVIDGDLTIGDGQNPFEIYGTPNKLPAAQTYIVKNGDLNIKSDIVYDDTKVIFSNPKTIPSAAFIVINGNINIDPTVTTIDGVLMAVNTQGNSKGTINSTGETVSEFILTIRGSLIGNVLDLFTQRRASADPTQDEGSIVVRYDERLLLNTPPGLNDLIDISQLRVAN